MNLFSKTCTLFFSSIFSLSILCALEPNDQQAIQDVIKRYTDAWNLTAGKGFGNDFTEDADFVNIFGMHFSGKAEIEERHVQILQTFLKDTTLQIADTRLREVQPGLVVALVYWTMGGDRAPPIHPKLPIEVREGIFTQVFVNLDGKWQITASQNTLIPVR